MMDAMALGIILGGFAGGLLGLVYFGGLKMTVDRLAAARRPGLLFAGSFLFRVILVTAGFVYVLRESLAGFLAGFLVFILVRERMTSKFRPLPPGTAAADEGAGREHHP